MGAQGQETATVPPGTEDQESASFPCRLSSASTADAINDRCFINVSIAPGAAFDASNGPTFTLSVGATIGVADWIVTDRRDQKGVRLLYGLQLEYGYISPAALGLPESSSFNPSLSFAIEWVPQIDRLPIRAFAVGFGVSGGFRILPGPDLDLEWRGIFYLAVLDRLLVLGFRAGAVHGLTPLGNDYTIVEGTLSADVLTWIYLLGGDPE